MLNDGVSSLWKGHNAQYVLPAFRTSMPAARTRSRTVIDSVQAPFLSWTLCRVVGGCTARPAVQVRPALPGRATSTNGPCAFLVRPRR